MDYLYHSLIQSKPEVCGATTSAEEDGSGKSNLCYWNLIFAYRFFSQPKSVDDVWHHSGKLVFLLRVISYSNFTSVY